MTVFSKPYVILRHRRVLIDTVHHAADLSPLDRNTIDDCYIRCFDHPAEAMELKPPTKVPLIIDPREETLNLAALRSLLDSVRNSLKVEFLVINEMILGAIEAWLLVYYSYGFDFTGGRVQLCRQVQKTYRAAFLCNTSTGSWMSYFKYKNAAFISAHLGDQELPIIPDPNMASYSKNAKYLFGGRFYKFLHVLSKRGFLISFACSVLQSKKGMPRPSDDDVKKAEEKSFLKMTTPVDQVLTFVYRWEPEWMTGSEFEVAHYNYSKWDIEYEIKRTVRELFSDWRPDIELLTRIFLPSPSANYNRCRSKYGTYGEIQTLDEFRSFRDDPKACIDFNYRMTKLSGYVSEYYGEKGITDFNKNFDRVRECMAGDIDISDFLSAWRTFYWRCVHLALNESPLVNVVGLKEALKVRCISKGPPLTYFVLKPIQKSMWSQLQKFWNFELTGTPITDDLINERFSKYIGCFFKSGDWSAATDELKSWCSDVACDELFKVGEENVGYALTVFHTLTKRALTGHIFENKAKLQLPQVNGQLMGSVVSFPILNILNMTVLRMAYEKAHNVIILIRDCPIWVNGDDCLVAYVSPSFAGILRGLGNIMGFIESVGKVYDSKKFCSINSAMFEIEENRFRIIKYVNLGLLLGLNRSDATNSKKPPVMHPVQLGVWHKSLIEDFCDVALKARVDYLFKYKHRKVLETYTGHWYMPRWCGGLDMVPVGGYTSEQLEEGFFLRQLLGTAGLVPPRIPVDKNWIHFDRFNGIIRRELPLVGEYNYSSYQGEELYGNAFLAVTWRTFLSEGVKGLYNPHEDSWQGLAAEMTKFNNSVRQLRGKSGLKYGRLEPWEMNQEKKEKVTPLIAF